MHKPNATTPSQHSAEKFTKPELDVSSLYALNVSLWSIQESLLQSYRSVFLTCQSILLAIATFAAQGRFSYFALILALPGLLLLKVWRPITDNRGLGVFYFQWQLLQMDAGKVVTKDVVNAFKNWQNKPVEERRKDLSNDPAGRKLVSGPVRNKLDSLIPWTFFYCWIVIMLFAIVPSLRGELTDLAVYLLQSLIKAGKP